MSTKGISKEEFIDEVKSALDEHDITHAELAHLCGFSCTRMYKLMSGRVDFSGDEMSKVVNAIDRKRKSK